MSRKIDEGDFAVAVEADEDLPPAGEARRLALLQTDAVLFIRVGMEGQAGEQLNTFHFKPLLV